MPIPQNFSSPIRMLAKDRAFNQLQRWIIDGTLEPGEKIYDSEISKALGISRTPIREALQLLEVQGFIEMQPGKETRVTEIKKEDVLKIYPPLASLHALAAEEAAKIVTAEQIETLKEMADEYGQLIDRQEQFKAMESDEQFHNYIVELADNPYITDFSSILQLHIRRFKYVFLKRDFVIVKESLKEHRALIQAFEEHQAEKAASLMRQNWLRPMKEVYSFLVGEKR
ncbi:GntR family transcriptional regulator [Sporolactobacillus sp. CQH2019]|uniref:GntR family transcriptional regulator n=1 Tax=Sporolactobacillus sp. CQH2019 TaxID=3023512 RepID=UPI002368E59B|nr:GntR family transcriptional regulator [Sporolactobacillus sp. CQH2019]MDD9149126.1 GntR family transcriptional regulator [Sporolactobacillus sp. CQH2019]